MGQKAKNAGKKSNKTKQNKTEDNISFEEYMKSIPTMTRIPKYSEVIKTLKKDYECDIQKTCQNKNCGKRYSSETKENFKLCGNCKSAYYCCKDCQKTDWVNHKKKCGFIGLKESELSSHNKNFIAAVNIHINYKKNSCLENIGNYWLCDSQDNDCYYLKTLTKEEFTNNYLKKINNTDKAIEYYEEQIKIRSIYIADLEEAFIIA